MTAWQSEAGAVALVVLKGDTVIQKNMSENGIFRSVVSFSVDYPILNQEFAINGLSVLLCELVPD